MDKEIAKKTTIEIEVGLDENQVPVQMDWKASDGGGAGSCKAFMLALWDGEEENAMRIDLWDKEMSIYDMQRFFHQTLLTMSDTYARATGQKELSSEMQAFAQKFAEKAGILG